ncbi:MAG: hypothetical protein HXS54_14275 [Theionarchaea archaeon]|nr:hypothetical protein [Theionarchaea archaeon]
MDGDYVIWEDYRNGNKDIYGYNLSTGEEFQITTDPEIQSEPAIYGDLVVWTDWRNRNRDIYGYNLSTKEEFQITTNASHQISPAIYGNYVVWIDRRNGNWDIYGYNLSKERSQIWIFLPILGVTYLLLLVYNYICFMLSCLRIGVTYLLLLVYKRKFLEALQFE